MSSPLTIVDRVERGEHLAQGEMAATMDQIMLGTWSPGDIGRLLLALRKNGETVDEITGAAEALRKHMTPLVSARSDLLDTCGTGGDGSSTFNISTAAALVTAAAGQPVAKHGNRRVTSRSGSADVLQSLGLNIELGVEQVAQLLDELGICFCFAPLYHGAMARVAEVRRSLGVPTIFNLLGPLANPARAPLQILGVGRDELRSKLAQVLQRLGTRRALVVHGEDRLDEVTCTSATRVVEVTPAGLREFTWQPGDFGLTAGRIDDLRVDGPEQSAAMIREVLAGQRGAPRDIVVANAGAALWLARRADSPAAAAQQAAQAIDRGAARNLLERLAQRSQELKN